MFDVGFTELVLVFVIGLLILGPERLPRVAAQLGRWVAKARRTANQLRYQLEREVALDEVYRAQKQKKSQRPDTKPADNPASPAPPGDPAAADSAAAAGATDMGHAEGGAAPAQHHEAAAAREQPRDDSAHDAEAAETRPADGEPDTAIVPEPPRQSTTAR